MAGGQAGGGSPVQAAICARPGQGASSRAVRSHGPSEGWSATAAHGSVRDGQPRARPGKRQRPRRAFASALG
eukprot:11207283-Lingulodinium_polyedra.AAC.1